MLIRGLLIIAARRVGSCAIGGAVLWQVVLHAGPRDCEVVVHVSEVGATVKIDGWVYPVDPNPGMPIVCDLRPGNHTLTMSRDDRLLYREDFTLGLGEYRVLTAYDETRPPPKPIPRPAPGPGPGGIKKPDPAKLNK
jgi:hypothetical protein